MKHNVGEKDTLFVKGVECFLRSIKKPSLCVHRFNDWGDIINEVDKKSFRDNNMAPLYNILSIYLKKRT